VELARGLRAPRVLDHVADRAGVAVTGRPHAGAGGGIVQPGRHRGRPVILRLGISGRVADPTGAARGLRRVADVPGLPVPEVVGEGRLDDVAWTVETRLPGSPPRRLTPTLLGSAVAALGAMPTTDLPAWGAARDDLRRITAALPGHAAHLAGLETRLGALDSLPAVIGQGDLWTGNLLQRDGLVTGIVDWDAWREDAAPGTDLLQLFATAWRMHLGLPLGAIFGRRPWRHPRFGTALAGYWRRLGVRPDEAQLDAVGLAWWAREVAGTLTRFPELREDAPWLAANVGPVLAPGGRERAGVWAATPPPPITPPRS
jgi:hypothetical protein